MLLILLISLLFGTAIPATAQEFSLLGGVIHKVDPEGDSYAGQMEFREQVINGLAGSVSYLNEGHLPGDRQDGYLLQMWGKLPVLHEHLSLAAGVGPYLYFNTTKGENCTGSHCNDHGVGFIGSAELAFEGEEGWLLQVRSNYVVTKHSETLSALFGVGYHFGDTGPQKRGENPEVPANEVTLLGGQTTVNSLSSEHSPALSIEYRRHLLRYLDVSAAWLYEGDTNILRRNGAVVELWLVRPLLADTLSLGVGGGTYLASDHYSGHSRSQRFSAIATLTARYRIGENWGIRSSWHRVITVYDGDTDVIMAGIGYLF